VHSFSGDVLAVGTFSGAVLMFDIPSAVMLTSFDGAPSFASRRRRSDICFMRRFCPLTQLQYKAKVLLAPSRG
jgi:hypothetical protein